MSQSYTPLEEQFFDHHPGPFKVRIRKESILRFDIVCTKSNTPVATTDASMFISPDGAEIAAKMLTEYLNLNYPIPI